MLRRVPLLVVAVLSGCGSGDPIEAAGGWFRAVAEGDAARACAVMEPTGVAAVRNKYTRLGTQATCERVVAVYADRFDGEKAETILEAGFEKGDPTDGNRIGIFPAAPEYEFEVVLMEEVDGEWRVVSVGLEPS